MREEELEEDVYDLTEFLKSILEEDEEETASNDFEGIEDDPYWDFLQQQVGLSEDPANPFLDELYEYESEYAERKRDTHK